MADHRPIVLHSSWRGRATAFVGPSLLIALGGWAVAAAGFQLLNTFLLGLGLVLAIVVLLDYPLHSTVGPEGITRRCVLRSEHLPWDVVRTISRPGRKGDLWGGRQMFGSGGAAGGAGSSRGSSGTQVSRSRSGLVAEVGKRPYLLVDQIESAPEHEALAKALRAWRPGMAFRASKPAAGVPPTWLYKRRRGPSPDALVDQL